MGDAICFQEHHLNGCRVAEQEQRCRQVSWSAVLTPGANSVGASQQRAVGGDAWVVVCFCPRHVRPARSGPQGQLPRL
eukprot:4810498-Pyramimonas_sp.AAC.2